MALSISIQNLAEGQVVDLHAIGVASGYVGAALGVSMVVPQIVRTFRNRALPGVSVMTWALTALSCLGWLLYGFRADEVPQIPGNVLIVGGAVIVVLAVPSAASVPVRAVRLGVPAFVLCVLALVLPPASIGLLALAIGLVSALPQTYESLTHRSQNGSAVSVLAWVLRGASQVCWLGYALALHDVTVTISALVILASTMVLVTSELSRHPAIEPLGEVSLPGAPPDSMVDEGRTLTTLGIRR